MQLFEAAKRCPRKNRLDFAGDPDNDTDPGFFKRILYLLLPFLYRQLRIKRESHLRWRYALYQVLFS